jgi:V8-like Glu-specific endopeptidase
MALKSVDNPRPRRSALEGLEVGGVQRQVMTGSPGQADAVASRAADQFLVRGTSSEPLRPRRSALESLLTDVDRRKQILETDLAPWRMICALEMVGPAGQQLIGTGWFIGPRTLMTAGHCVFDPDELGGWARQITITPGRNGDRRPFPSAVSTSFSTTDRWLEAQDADFDYAAIHLDTDVGTPIGAFGVAVLPDAELTDRMLNVSGYPLDPGNGTEQYFHANRVKALTPRRIFYDIDTLGGQSGSPVWAYLDGSNDPVVVGIHAYGVGGVPAGLGVQANSGPRILAEVMDVIHGWMQRAAPG